MERTAKRERWRNTRWRRVLREGGGGSIVAAALAALTPAAAHATAHPLTVGDYGGDHKTDLTVFRPSNGTWYSIDSASGGSWSMPWGQSGDIPVSGDYSYGGTADGITDTMVYRPSTGVWYFADSVTFGTWWQQWGGQGDIPISGDWDGDGLSDIAIWRHFTNSGYPAGMWWIINSHDWSVTASQLGQEGDIPVPCDYDGDGKSDLAVFRPSDSTWHVLFSGWANNGPSVYTWGVTGSVPIPGDYDGDGICDFGAWNPSTGYFEKTGSVSGGPYWTDGYLGQAGDVPAPGDYDGDGKTDVVVWRPSNATWYGIRSSDGGHTAVQWGSGGPNNGGIGSDVALPNFPGSVKMIADLDVPQQQYNWCWAATAQMAAAYSSVTINQCDEANVATGRTDCCTNASSASDPNLCNVPGWWSELVNYGFTYDNTDWGTALSFTQLQSELNANRPVPYAWGWTGGGGHAMVAVKTWIDGSGTQWVSINNPDPVNVGEQDDMTYAYWVSAADHVHWQDSYNLILQ